MIIRVEIARSAIAEPRYCTLDARATSSRVLQRGRERYFGSSPPVTLFTT